MVSTSVPSGKKRRPSTRKPNLLTGTGKDSTLLDSSKHQQDSTTVTEEVPRAQMELGEEMAADAAMADTSVADTKEESKEVFEVPVKAKLVKTTAKLMDKFNKDDQLKADVKNLLENLYWKAKSYKAPYQTLAIEAADYYDLRRPPQATTGGARYVAPVVQEKVNDLHTQIMDMANKLKDNFSVKVHDAAMTLPPGLEARVASMMDNSLYQKDEHIINGAVKESLLAGTAFLRWYTDEVQNTEVDYFKDLTKEQLEVLRVEAAKGNKDTIIEVTLESPGTKSSGKLMSGQIVKPRKESEVRFEHLTFDKVLVDPLTRKLSESTYVCVKSFCTRQDLIENGYDKETVMNLTTESDLEVKAQLNTGVDHIPSYGSFFKEDTMVDKGLDVMLVREVYLRTTLLDKDDTFKLYRIIEVNGVVLDIKEEDYINLAVLRPIPSMDSFYGATTVAALRTQQDVKSALIRGFIDNIHNANHGRVIATQGQYNKRDLIDNRPHGIVEVEVQGAIQPFPYNPLPGGIDALLALMDVDADNVSGISAEVMGRGESAFASGITASQIAIAHSKTDLTIKNVAKGIMSGIRALCKGIYNEYRKEFTKLPSISTFNIEVQTETGRRSKSADIMAAFQAMTSAGMMTPQLKDELSKEYMRNVGLSHLTDKLKTPQQQMQEQQAQQQAQANNPELQIKSAIAQAQVKNLDAQTQTLLQNTEIEAAVKAAQLNRDDDDHNFKHKVEVEKLNLERSKLKLEEYETGVRTQVAITEAGLKAQQMLAGEEVSLAAAQDILTDSGTSEQGL